MTAPDTLAAAAEAVALHKAALEPASSRPGDDDDGAAYDRQKSAQTSFRVHAMMHVAEVSAALLAAEAECERLRREVQNERDLRTQRSDDWRAEGISLRLEIMRYYDEVQRLRAALARREQAAETENSHD